MNYICLECGEEVSIENKKKKEHIKCEQCGCRCVMKKRKPTQYISR